MNSKQRPKRRARRTRYVEEEHLARGLPGPIVWVTGGKPCRLRRWRRKCREFRRSNNGNTTGSNTNVDVPAKGIPDLGVNASLRGKVVFPPDNPWNQDISSAPVDPNSDAIIATIGVDEGMHPDFGSGLYLGTPIGIPYVIVSGSQPTVPVTFQTPDESDPGPYPIPANAPVEGGSSSTGDRHVLVIDRDHWALWEMFAAYPAGRSSWTAYSGAKFDLNSNALRPLDWTSADAAGLPIFPGLVRADEVYERHVINHALRFTVKNTRKGFVYPARHFASTKKIRRCLLWERAYG